jgi:glutamate racemase
MLGFFDSGFGGLTVLREAVRLLPEYSYLYLGDNARAPYGNRHQEVIYQFTTEGVKELFSQGAELIILACNTSSSAALRRLQQEFLPENFPHKNVLGIIIPTAEEIGKLTKSREVGVLGTKATVESLVYPKEIAKVWPDIRVYQEAAPNLVPLIEEGDLYSPEIYDWLQIYLDELLMQSARIDAVILGCTHYALIENQIKRYLPAEVALVSQGRIIALKLADYLRRHPEIEQRLAKTGERRFYTTGDVEQTNSLARLFYGQRIQVEKIFLSSRG